MSISTSLRRAAKLQAKIEGLRTQLTDLLDRARSEVASLTVEEIEVPSRRPGRPKMFKSNGRRRAGKPAAVISQTKTEKGARAPKKETAVRRAGKGRKRSPLLGVKRAASPTGPLSPAVVAVLKAKRKPMNVGDILTGLNANGYQFNSAEPKKNLAARIYRLKGVKQAGPGLFELA